MPDLFDLTDSAPQQAALPVEQPYLGVPQDADGLRRVYINGNTQAPDLSKPITNARPDIVGSPGLFENSLSDLSGTYENLKSKVKDLDAHILDNFGMAGVEDKTGKSEHPLLKQLFGLGGEERFQFWPEKVVREALSAAHDAATGKTPEWAVDPVTGDVHTSPQMVESAQAMSALAGSGGMAGTTDATLGSAPFLRPALKYEGKIYKAPANGQHLDALPAHLAEDFQQKAMSGEDINHYNFGFVNHKGQFLDREKALDYAVKEGLVDPSAGQYGALTSTLLADSSKPGTAIEAMAKTGQPFYSALEHNIDKIGQAKMTGDQWLGTLANKPGVKPEELDWTGVKDFLKERGNQPVTKAELQEHLTNNKIELKEVDKGARDPLNAQEKIEYDALKKRFDEKDFSLNADDAAKYAELGFKAKRMPDSANPTKYHGYQLPGGPLSRDTEILTNKSWKRIDAIEIGDIVMTRRDEGGILEWQPVLATPKVYAEELYHFSSQSVDMRVTENHQMIAKKRRRNSEGLQRLTAKELWSKSEMLIPLTGNWDGEDEDKIFGFDANDLAELFGWYLAEGSCKLYKEGKNTIQISQCREYNPEKCDRIEALLNRMGLPWRYYGDAYGIGIKTINKDLVELLHEQPTSEFKFVPYFFFEQSKSVIQSLLDGLILGDGCTSVQENRLDKTTFFTKSWQLAGDVQALILMIGKNANVRQRPSGLYCVGIKSKEWSSVDEAKFEIAPYNDFAFCVTVENHAIYVRRNGVAAFTGNSNYREKLLTLPNKQKRLYEYEYFDPKTQTSKQFKTEAEAKAAAPEGAVVLPKEVAELNPAYKSSHWDEPNILAHVRMNDRMIDGKKSLHIEEIQSDWHQQGRDRGYRPTLNSSEEKELVNLRDRWQQDQKSLSKDELNRFQELDNIKQFHGGVPDAPFKKNWHELALKRMIREAAEKGYDRLSWTPGEAQAARYDLSKQINTVVYKDGKLTAIGKGGNHVINNESVTPEKLSDYLGKEGAKKLIDQKEYNGAKSLQNADLKIGGEGMKGFYDQIIPKALEKISGEKVKTASISTPAKSALDNWPKPKIENHPVHYIDIPQSLKDKALHQGFPLFSGNYMYSPVVGNPFENKK